VRFFDVGLSLNVNGYLTEETRKKLAPVVVETFNDSQKAWDAYCEHLIAHGLLTPARKVVLTA
jgi:hypothetical protein